MTSPPSRSLRRPRAATKSELNIRNSPQPLHSTEGKSLEPPAKRQRVTRAGRELETPPRSSGKKDQEQYRAYLNAQLADKKTNKLLEINAKEYREWRNELSREGKNETREPAAQSFGFDGSRSPKPDATYHEKKRRLEQKERNSRDKVANGIRHELALLQPAEVDIDAGRKDEKRKLRSVEGRKYKSELSTFFPEYDVVIGNEKEETQFFNTETPILVVDNSPSLPRPTRNTPSPQKRARLANGAAQTAEPKFRRYSNDIFYNLNRAQKIDFAFLGNQPVPKADPLLNSLYSSHKQRERREKSQRNDEKSQAEYKRDHIKRLLDGLEGHDWLKVLGVSTGVVSEQRAREFEPMREYFIKSCEAILKRFSRWKEEEKRRSKGERRRESGRMSFGKVEEDEGEQSDGDPPDYSDLDQAAAKQLHDELVKRAEAATLKKIKLKVNFRGPTPEDGDAEFKSFFKKPQQRRAAMDRNRRRRSDRSVLAFGVPIPDVHDREFALPGEWLPEGAERVSPKKRASRRRSSIISQMP